MIGVKVDTAALGKLMAHMSKATRRAAEQALDSTAKEIKEEIRAQLPRVFDRPTTYTMNSLRVIPTRNHNMMAAVWFKEPERMGQHYLAPEVEGGQRKLKGFEKYSMGGRFFAPGRGAVLDRYGNVSGGQIRQMMSVLGRAETHAGATANITKRSRKANTKVRDFVYLPKGAGKLPPGIYHREVAAGAVKASAKDKRRQGVDRSKNWQASEQGAVRARGLRAVLVQTRRPKYRRRLPFYEIAERVARLRLSANFMDKLAANTLRA